jgi:hypothetical protein
MKKFIQLALLFLLATPCWATTWYVRSDGGTRYSTRMTGGQCNGQYDASYSSTGGTGVNQNCAFNDVRYLWQDGSWQNDSALNFPAWGWVGQGGDTYVIEGGPWRVGWPNANSAYDGTHYFGVGGDPYSSPPVPFSGTSGSHTRILGACAYGTYTCNPVITYPYTSNNLAQIFGGFATGIVLNLSGAQYVDVEGLEITAHNGACSVFGTVRYPSACSTSAPVSDYASDGLYTNNATSNITLQDLYIHGFNVSGLQGPIGGPITMTRVFVGFNVNAGWQFDDGNATPDGAGSAITANYVWMEGNGCEEQYPIVNTQFPAVSCWDDSSGGFGDSWSGQGSGGGGQVTPLAYFTGNHLTTIYNTKDGFIGPHTQITNLTLTNSVWIGNMGQQVKYSVVPGSTTIFENNLVDGNCSRMSQQLPGAAQNFALSTGLGGSYLSDFCRAGSNVFEIAIAANSTSLYAGNTIVAYDATVFDLACATAGTCTGYPYTFKDNIFLGYTPSGGSSAPGLFYQGDSSVSWNSSYNVEYGIRNGDTCGVNNNIICSDPLLTNEPAQSWPGSQTAFDVFNPFNTGNSFEMTSSSPAKAAGTALSGLTTDYFGTTRPSPPAIGALEYGAHSK